MGNICDKFPLQSFVCGEFFFGKIQGIVEFLNLVETGDKVRSIVGRLAMEILEQVKVSGVFLTGGDTALGMLMNIEADGSQILSEIRVGIPLVQVKGGKYEGMKLVTKAGAFGADDAADRKSVV